MRLPILLFISTLSCFCLSPVRAQNEASTNSTAIETAAAAPSDAEIYARITQIFGQIDDLGRIEISVDSGVVTMTGVTTTAEAAQRAVDLAERVDGVVTVENQIERDVSVSTRLTPAIGQLRGTIRETAELLPLIVLALTVFAAIAGFGWMLSAWKSFWRRIAPNAFVGDLVRSTMRAVFVVLGAVAALSLLDATALLGAFLGAAGVLGLAIGFAVRDTIENYIASVMLSLRQPFRPNDHVVIGDQEGRVVRLTSRATVLMTLQGNHVRIPNATVFKAVILNYSRNPERRFEFELGVDADDDPLAAIDTGLEAIRALSFVLRDPSPLAFIKDVGDSNIVIFFAAWINQSSADFAKSRSVALAVAKIALEDAGFALPEPIYRLRFDASAPSSLTDAVSQRESTFVPVQEGAEAARRAEEQNDHRDIDVAPDTDISEKVEEERREQAEDDLLSDDAPVE